MRRYSFGLLVGSLTLALSALLVAGCGSSKTDDDDDYVPKRKAKKSGGGARPVQLLKVVKAAERGVIKGKVNWTGGDVAFDNLTADLKKLIGASENAAYCLTGKLGGEAADFKTTIQPCETVQQRYRIGANKGLGNVFVWIEPERGHYFEIPKEQIDAVAKEEVTLHQPHCAFLPHCTVLFPSYYGADGKQVPTGQKFLVENDARVGHNANIQGPVNGSRSNSIPVGSKLQVDLVPEKSEVTVSCNVHGWMRAYMRVFDHPYAAVTSVGADRKAKKWEDLASPAVGSFEIKGVPVGAKVKFFAWHEELGFINKGGSTGEEMVLKKDNDITIDAKPK
jgi:hypothetical protein